MAVGVLEGSGPVMGQCDGTAGDGVVRLPGGEGGGGEVRWSGRAEGDEGRTGLILVKKWAFVVDCDAIHTKMSTSLYAATVSDVKMTSLDFVDLISL